ncbi:MAG: hypothetical protein JRG90_12875 [Deltaproteobacteria bacterium]|nr:hypothetical protein [Deltaproteobacteria bacterium]
MGEILNQKATKRDSNSKTLRILRAAALVGLVSLALCLSVGASAADAEHDYVGVAKCKTCHKKDGIGNQYGTWLDTKHAKAYETLGSDQAKKWAAEAGVDDPQTDDKCVKCHVTAHGVPAERLSRKFDKTLGVQCESCHGAGKDYRKKKIMIDLELAKSKGLVKPEEKDCVTCHNDESPAWKPDRYTRDDGSKVGFDFDQAAKAIAHPVPEGYDPMAEGEAD